MAMVKSQIREHVNRIREELSLPAAARAERRRDRAGLPALDPGREAVVGACMDWLCRAQDRSASADGGVARDFSLIGGWATSYPETTGYIVPTFIAMAQATGNEDYHRRARRMLDWLVSIQFADGGFQGGRIDSQPRVPVTFNTGQILLGLAAGAAAYGQYRPAMDKAAAFLRDSLDSDGCWRKHPTPFAKAGEKAYETHVAWGLLEAARVAPDAGYGEAGLRNIAWALTRQAPNGWFADCCLSEPDRPLTHTIGYVLRGVVEGYLFARDPAVLAAARRTADALAGLVAADGYLPGRWYRDWRPAVDWVCLTGSVQIAHSLLLLFRETGESKYRDAACRLNAYVRRTVRIDGDPDVRGAVKGAFPVDGDYGRFEYLNWAPKFCIDSNLLEAELCPGPGR
ncbi:MAG: hypothetical protein AB7Q97_02780 [Gammaproteobacteria bacterium]